MAELADQLADQLAEKVGEIVLRPGTPEVFATSLARNTHLVAERDGQVVGPANLGRLTKSYRDFPHVSGEREVMWKLYVHPDHQGAGVGARLLAEVEQLVEGDELWLEVVGDQWPDDIWLKKALR